MKKIIYLVLALFVITLSNCDPDKVKKTVAPAPAFSADPTLIEEGQSVYFTDESENDPTA